MGQIDRAAVRRRVTACAAALLLLAGCGSGDTPPAAGDAGSTRARPQVVRAAELKAGDAVPAPAGRPVLTVTGKISQPNSPEGLALDAAALDRMGVASVAVFEPWTKQDMQFQGVWLRDLLRIAGAADDATTLHVTALDDYQVDLKLADVRAEDVLLATRDGSGRAIPVEDGGPTRIVFGGDAPSGKNADQWIWSLTTVDVR